MTVAKSHVTKCGTCIDREAAFAANGVVDPLAEV